MDETVILAPASYIVDPDVGSDPERPWRLIQGLAKSGVRVIVVARQVTRADALGARVTLRPIPGPMPSTPFGRLIDRVRLYMHARAVAAAEASRGGVLVVHHFGPCGPQSPSLVPKLPVPFVYGPMPGVRRRVSSANADWRIWLGLPDAPRREMLAGFGLAKTLGPIAHMLWLRTIRRADAVTVEARVNSPVERPDAIVVPAGIDTDFFAPDAGGPVSGRVVAVGSLVPRKGFDILVRALGIAAHKNPSAHLIIAGSGPEKPELERLATTLGVAPRITFWGQVARRELPGLYRSASLVCHPARLDNYPTVVMEAMACGVPVLVSASGSLPELVGGAGLVHTVGDAEQLAGQIVGLLGDEKLRRELSVASRERAVSRHSFTVMSQRYLEIYRGLNAQKLVEARR